MKNPQKVRQRQKNARFAQKTRMPAGAGARGRWFRPVVVVLGIGLAGFLVFAVVEKSRHASDSSVSNKPGGPPLLSTGSNAAVTAATNASGQGTARDTDTAATSLIAKGNEQLKAGDIESAIRSYREALALTPEDEDLHFNLGIAYAKRGDFTNAEAEYREALRLLPDYPEVHNNLGNLLMRSGKLAEAEKEFTEAINQLPEYAQAHNNLGIVRQRQNRSQEAILSFQKAVQYETNYWQAHFNLATAFFQQKMPEKSVTELRETLRINPTFQPAQQLLAQIESQGPNVPPVPQPPTK